MSKTDATRDEIEAFADLIRSSAAGSTPLTAEDLAEALRHHLVKPALADSYDFAAGVAVGDEKSPDRDGAVTKAVFVYLSMDPDSRVAALLREAASRAMRLTGGASRPFLDEDDLLQVLRWKLWQRPTPFFSREGMLRNLEGYVRVAARRLAIDQIRQLGGGRFRPTELNLVELDALPSEQVASTSLEWNELVTALRPKLTETQDWLLEPALELLTKEISREQGLVEINRVRAAHGEKPWSQNALDVFLHRLRLRIREILSQRSDL